MRICKFISILAAAVILASFAAPALADNQPLKTTLLKGLDRTAEEWMSSKNNREMFAAVATVDLILTVGGTDDQGKVFEAMSSAMAEDKCYAGISNGGMTVSVLYFGDENSVVIFYSPSIDLGEWMMAEGSTSYPKSLMEELKSGGTFESYYQVSGERVVEILQEVSQGLGN